MRMTVAYIKTPYVSTPSHGTKTPHWPVKSGTSMTAENMISQRRGYIWSYYTHWGAMSCANAP